RRDFRDLLTVLLYDDDSSSDSSDEEDLDLLFLDAAFGETRTLDKRPNIADLSEIQCEEMFRFGKDDILHLCEALELPEFYTGHQGSVFTGIEALMVMLRRLAYPNRLCDLVDIFGRAEPELSIVFNMVTLRHSVMAPNGLIAHLYGPLEGKRHDAFMLGVSGLLPQLERITKPDGEPYVVYGDPAYGISRHIIAPFRGAHLTPLQQQFNSDMSKVRASVEWGFGKISQYFAYLDFHKNLKSVMAPNGLIAHLYGPLEGKRHDAFMLGVSGLLPQLERITKPDGEPYVVYGDPAYGISRHIIAPFRGAHLTPLQQQFNSDMSKVRASVEWGFGKISQYFAYLDFHKNLKVLLQPVGKYYAVGALLANCHTCLYGSVTSSFFELEPPSLEVYLSNN
ncbi:unnamed protein product, partial [Porites evermanni]